jgi:hypothetical protein
MPEDVKSRQDGGENPWGGEKIKDMNRGREVKLRGERRYTRNWLMVELKMNGRGSHCEEEGRETVVVVVQDVVKMMRIRSLNGFNAKGVGVG